MKKNTLIISKKWSTNRGDYTSVERFCSLLDPDFKNYHGKRVTIHPKISFLFRKYTNSKADPAFGYSAPYNSWSFELEVWGFINSLRHRPKVIFFPYADYDYYYFRYLRHLLPAKIVLWSYFSRRELDLRFTDLKHFATADLVLAAGQDQVDYLSEHLPKTHVEYFPMGVDTDFFRPTTVNKNSQNPRIVHVGANRRDFATLINGLDQLRDHYPNIRVDLIGAHTIKEKLPQRDYIQIHDFLNDEQFRAILQQANIGLLCMEDGGSSNSLLEMMASGLPIIITNLVNIQDYLNDSFCIRIPKGDPVSLYQGCQLLLENIELRKQMAIAAREQSKKYSWESLLKDFQEKIEAISTKE